jgi:shikimate kinase
MSADPNCVILIGMPAAGKSTIGVLLAKDMGKGFLDTDLAIQEATGRALQDIVDADGHHRLRAIEDETLRTLAPNNQVVATGGSAVYSDAAMRHLRGFGPVVHLSAELATIEARIGDPVGRGLARQAGQSVADLFRERLPLYQAHADVTVTVDGLSHREVVDSIRAALNQC